MKRLLRHGLILLLTAAIIAAPFYWPERAYAATREFYYAESTAESSITGTTADQTKTTLTFTPTSGATYFLIASWLEQITGTTDDVRAKLTGGPSAVTYQENNIEPKEGSAPLDYRAQGGLGIYTVGAEETAQDFFIKYSTEDTGSTARIKEAKLIAIKKDSADVSAESTAGSTCTTTAYCDKVTTGAFTPATTGDYIIVAAMDVLPALANNPSVRMDVDGTAQYGQVKMTAKDTSNYYTWMLVKRLNLTNASHTIKLQFNAEAGGLTSTARNARVIVMRADAFEANYYDDFTTRETNATASYVTTTASITQTPAAVDHLIIAGGMHDGSSTTTTSYVQLREGSTTLSEQMVEPDIAATDEAYPFFAIYSKEFTAVSTTWDLQLKSESTNTTGLDEAAISVIQLEAVVVSSVTTRAAGSTANTTGAITHSDGYTSF